MVAAAGHNRLVYVWASGGVLKTFKGHTLGVTDIAFSRDGRQLASACKDRKIIVWDLQG
jgi:COMPASS component SWD3